MINKENFVYNKLIEANQYNQCVVTYKTYQMYRRDSLNEIECDLRRFDRFGLKIVRGAYHSKDDKELFQTKKETDDNYNDMILELLKEYPCAKRIDGEEKEIIQYASTCKNIILSHGSFSAIIGYLAFYSEIYYPEYEAEKMWYGDMFSIEKWKRVTHKER